MEAKLPFDDVRGGWTTPKHEELPLLPTFFLLTVFAAILAAIDLRVCGVLLIGLVILVALEHRQRISRWFASGWWRIKQCPIVAQF